MPKLSQYNGALKPSGRIAFDAGGEGKTGSPGYAKLESTAGTAYYLSVGTDGKLYIHTSVPATGSEGTLVGGQAA